MNPASQNALQLRDIHLPPDPGFWPPAPGWWLLAAVLLVLLIWALRLLWQRMRLHRQRRHILQMLADLEQQPDGLMTPQGIARLSLLLRRLALMRYPRHKVAALTGEDWLHFLDESGGEGRFCHGPGQVLANGPYQPSLPEAPDSQALAELLRDWVKKNTDTLK